MVNEDKRNYGIDLLRIVAMFFIIMLHCYGQGGVLYTVTVDSSQYKLAWFIEIFAYCAVDIFALISGYVCYREENQKIKFSRYINLWLQVVFYGIVLGLIFNAFDSKLFFPVANNLYWYFTAYTGLFFLMPIINNAIKNSNNELLKKTFIMIFIFFSIFSIFFNVFVLEKGYSFIWILLLYIMGAIIKKCDIGRNMKEWKAAVGILILVIVTYLYKMYGYTNDTITKDILVSYISPTILLSAVLYVIWFSKMKFNNIMKKIIKFAAGSAFSIYIINNHQVVWDNLMNRLFVEIANKELIGIIIHPLIFSVLFVIAAILIDKVRIFIFKILRIDKVSKFIEDKLDWLLDSLIRDKTKNGF